MINYWSFKISSPSWLSKFKSWRGIFLTLLVFTIFTFISFGFYSQRSLKGDLKYHFLPTSHFGIPSELAEKGITPLYKETYQLGWDGQFYYYMANDILATKDTEKHLDESAYRYQRIGLSLYTWLVSKVLMQTWVSPHLFFAAYFGLLFIACLIGANVYASRSIPVWIILFWACSVGTQITLFNGLPDAAADAFLIISLPLLLKRRFLLASLPLTFSVLSREIYLLFPLGILLVRVIDLIVREHFEFRRIFFSLRNNVSFFALTIPIAAYFVWWVFIYSRFGVSPGSQAHGILGAPLKAWYSSISAAWESRSFFSLNPALSPPTYEFLGLLLYLLILIVVSIFSLVVIFDKSYDYILRGLSLSLIFISGVYLCFGPTVMMHYTGYEKVLGIYLFLVPLFSSGKINRRIMYLILCIFGINMLIMTAYNYSVRILALNFDAWTRMPTVDLKRKNFAPCFVNYNYEVEIRSINLNRNNDNFSGLFGKDFITVQVVLKNTSNHIFESYLGVGSVFMSYQWLDSDGAVVLDGMRTVLSPSLFPDASQTLYIVSQIPNAKARLFISPVQEGCAWFYRNSPNQNTSPIIQLQ